VLPRPPTDVFFGEYLAVYFPLLSKKTLLSSRKYTVKYSSENGHQLVDVSVAQW
jgi:hypothetical protein